MPNPVPGRSAKGCLTCRRRKKKCDEKRPQCERCLLGNFECLGYAHLEGISSNSNHISSSGSITLSNVQDSVSHLLIEANHPTTADFLPFVSCMGNPVHPNTLSLTHPHGHPLSIPKGPQLDLFERDNMVDLVVSQYLRVARAPFRPFPYEFGRAIEERARSSDLVLKTMYIGARIAQALLDGTNPQRFVGWIDSFHRQISWTQPLSLNTGATHLADRLSAVHDLTLYAFMLTDSRTGYSLLRQGVPIFLEFAAQSPQVWSKDSAISISHALNPTRHEMARFVLVDAISSLAFGTAPLINYDTTVNENEFLHGKYGFLEMGCAGHGPGSSNSGDIGDIEECVKKWAPKLDYTERPFESITRLAVQECWRQATLIYAYMGLCGADSSDDRVQPLVSQVAQLAATIEPNSPMEAHLFVPALIAGAAARKEKHRTVLRKKIQASRNIDARILRGADFVFVLDHLWHGAAVGGSPVTWEDYVTSRYAVMPLDV
ncbi:Fungal specific transcription factor domain [Rhizoctonia solani]|uniref:Fungal specific transcription factor domain n=1 Tax=Rhizoctonia solani TaxID=456999 RepID=A0A8H8SZF3_9AGAM|nr:Fungal specific transcription factor domain [Rhizoctonia solani]QRW24266.1 Fungal specific transcription factor domain [Rhizoctonia solani]